MILVTVFGLLVQYACNIVLFILNKKFFILDKIYVNLRLDYCPLKDRKRNTNHFLSSKYVSFEGKHDKNLENFSKQE